MTATDGMVAGFYHLQLAMRNSDGYPMGTETDPDNAANGTTTHAYLVPLPVSITRATPTYARATRQGAMKVNGTRDLGITDLGEFTVTLSGEDEVFDNLIRETTADVTTASNITITAPDVRKFDPPQMMLLATIGYQTNAGVNQFTTWAFHNVQISPTGMGAVAGQDDGTNPNTFEYTVTVNTATRTATGFPYSSLSLGVTDNDDMAIKLRHTSPFGLTTYVDDGSATTFTLGYRPDSSDATGATNIFTAEGADHAANVSGVVPSTGVVTHTAQTAGDIIVAMYSTVFTAI